MAHREDGDPTRGEGAVTAATNPCIASSGKRSPFLSSVNEGLQTPSVVKQTVNNEEITA